jgi:hypothetical protein
MSKPGSFMESLTAAARANPLGAALVTGGALWLLLGDRGLKSIAGSLAAAAEPVADLTARNIQNAAGHGKTAWESRRSEHLRETAESPHSTPKSAIHAASNAASRTIRSLHDNVESGTSRVRDALGAMPDVRSAAKQTYGTAQSSLGELLERQPLVLGAIGLAIGAVAAGGFESTRSEKELLGPLSDDLKSHAQRRGAALSKNLREAADTVTKKASEVAEEAVDRLRDAGVDAVEAARRPKVAPRSGNSTSG